MRSSNRSRRGFLFLPCEEQSVLHVARWMVGRKIQRLEVVVVGFDLGTFRNGIAEVPEYAHDFVHGADDRVFGAYADVECRAG